MLVGGKDPERVTTPFWCPRGSLLTGVNPGTVIARPALYVCMFRSKGKVRRKKHTHSPMLLLLWWWRLSPPSQPSRGAKEAHLACPILILSFRSVQGMMWSCRINRLEFKN